MHRIDMYYGSHSNILFYSLFQVWRLSYDMAAPLTWHYGEDNGESLQYLETNIFISIVMNKQSTE